MIFHPHELTDLERPMTPGGFTLVQRTTGRMTFYSHAPLKPERPRALGGFTLAGPQTGWCILRLKYPCSMVIISWA